MLARHYFRTAALNNGLASRNISVFRSSLKAFLRGKHLLEVEMPLFTLGK